VSRIVITAAPATSLAALRRLFADAVVAHFSYFPAPVQRRVIRDHSLLQLVRAKIDPKRVILVAKSGRQIVGYAIGAAPATGPAQLFWLYVDPNYRGANTGLTLLSRMLRVLASKGASEVSIATHDHRSYYERQGFKYVESKEIDGVNMDILVFRFGGRRAR
jgi:ribosomal protein S18 acetylase RimI-like enzyme